MPNLIVLEIIIGVVLAVFMFILALNTGMYAALAALAMLVLATYYKWFGSDVRARWNFRMCVRYCRDYGAGSVFVNGSDVYVAGRASGSLSITSLWTNGVPKNLWISCVRSVFVSGSDVYVVGYQAGGKNSPNRAKIRKNDHTRILDNRRSEASSIFVSGNDVYVAGLYGDRAALWKNDEMQNLSNKTSEANSVFVSDGDVYVAGFEGKCATLWKNGEPQQLGSLESRAFSVFVSEGDVFVVGYEFDSGTFYAMQWKNGVPRRLGEGAALSVFVSDGRVHAAGFEGNWKNRSATIWKNGVPQRLIAEQKSYANSIFVSGKDVYVAGNEDRRSILWKNGFSQPLVKKPLLGKAACGLIFLGLFIGGGILLWFIL